jgi:hypothetical protein
MGTGTTQSGSLVTTLTEHRSRHVTVVQLHTRPGPP